MRLTQLLNRMRAARRTLLLVTAMTASLGTGVTGTVATAATPHAAGTSKAQLIAKADLICRRVNRQTAPYQSQVTKLVNAKRPNYKRMASALNKSVTIEQTGLNQLRTLPAPAADRAAVTKIWNELGTIISASQDITTGVGNGDISAVNQATQRRTGAETVYRRLAQAFGFKYC